MHTLRCSSFGLLAAAALWLSATAASAKPTSVPAAARALKLKVGGRPYKLVERDDHSFTFVAEGKGKAPSLVISQSPTEPASELPGYLAGALHNVLEHGGTISEARRLAGDGKSEDTVYVYTSLFPTDDTTAGQYSVSRVSYREGRVFKVMLTHFFEQARDADKLSSKAAHAKVESLLAAVPLPSAAALATVPEFKEEGR